jgi:hypothetical protein
MVLGSLVRIAALGISPIIRLRMSANGHAHAAYLAEYYHDQIDGGSWPQ